MIIAKKLAAKLDRFAKIQITDFRALAKRVPLLETTAKASINITC